MTDSILEIAPIRTMITVIMIRILVIYDSPNFFLENTNLILLHVLETLNSA